MQKAPFFSILIPTKNRSYLVGFAIESVLDQTFSDFEVIVSDNDDSQTLTRDVVAEIRDPRIKYYKQSRNLSMADNWEFTLSKSTGHYITVLEDKQAFYPHALEIIYNTISKNSSKVIRWYNDMIDDVHKRPVFIKNYRSNIISKYSSDEILKDFVEGYERVNKLPDLINSCVSREIVDFVKQKSHLKRFFIPLAPDINAAFLQLNYVDDIILIDSSLCIMGALSVSYSTMFRRKAKGHERFFMGEKEFDKSLYFSHVPIKSCYLGKSIVINSYLRLREKLGGRLERFTISNRNYIIMCFNDIIRTQIRGGDAKDTFRLWKEYYKSQEKSIKKGLWLIFIKKVIKGYLQRYAINLPRVSNFYFRLFKSKTRRILGFNNILELVRKKKFQTLPGDLIIERMKCN